MLLAAAWKRVLIAGIAVAALWAAVLWVAPSTPVVSPVQPAVPVAPRPATPMAAPAGPLRIVVRSGTAAPGGGSIDRFDAPSQPVIAPVNARGQVAFHATVLRAAAREGIFLAKDGRLSKVAAFGDAVPGGGTITGFGEMPLPALNAAGHVAFNAQIAGGRGTDGIFLARDEGLEGIALAGDDAPGVPAGVLIGFNAPALNDSDELAFVATVRRGRDTLDVLYFWNGRRLQRLVAEGELLLRIGGTMDKIGEPALNNAGVVAFPASILKGPVVGGIFVAGARALHLLVGAGEHTGDGAMVLRFSDRVAIDDEDGVAFGAYLGGDGSTREAVLRAASDGLAVIATEGGEAPGGGRYAAFGPWPTATSTGVIAFVAALEGGPGPLAAFTATAGSVDRVATIGEKLANGTRIGRFALNAIAASAPNDALTFVTVADSDDARSAIWCRCPVPQR
ncbi:MAG TPA: choice-of-anchor tandem repeat NxxGxxAF-containing protein [Acetobacteraceae bacterium]|nr:choice-of-anchor tandem repeat NxxGxxAF-containing protein [Acetobacteraceae bacterium]